MKTKLLKRLRRQAESEVRIPCDMFYWILDIYYFSIDKFYNEQLRVSIDKFCNEQLRDYILYRVANMRCRRARRIIRWTVACIVMCSLSMVTNFIYGDWHSGMAWLCATMAWMVVVKHEKQEYKEK